MSGILVLVGSLGAAAFGILGQVTQFRRSDGRIARKAKFVLVGLAASALLSLAGGWLSDQESRQATDTRQEDLLRTIWQESNRIEAADLSVRVTFRPMLSVRRLLPVILEKNWTFNLIASTSPGPRGSTTKTAWRSKPILKDKELALDATDQTILRRHSLSVDGPSFRQMTTYSNFDGEMEKFIDPTRWNGAYVEPHLTAGLPDLPKKLWTAFFDEGDDTGTTKSNLRTIFRRLYFLPEDIPDFEITPLPIEAKFTVYVRNRPIGSGEAMLAAVREWDEDVRGLVVAKFPVIRISENTFPIFRPTPGAIPSPSSHLYKAVEGFAWLVITAMAVAAVGVARASSTS